MDFFLYLCAMKIALLKETKVPEDNRVALSPQQVAELNMRFPEHEIVVQSSPTRGFSDEEYRAEGVSVVDELGDCDVLFGIKEADLETLLPGKHYFFFGHLAKMQSYNKPLLQGMMAKGLTFSDYEYLTDSHHQRVCAFGWWAGVVGVYYMLRGWGMRTHSFALPAPTLRFTMNELEANLKAIELPSVRLLVTGAGRVSQGAQHILDIIGAQRVSEKDFLDSSQKPQGLQYTVADVDKLVVRRDGGAFGFADFAGHPEQYESDFQRWAKAADILLCAHFWAPESPVYLDEALLESDELRIRMVADITCDIMGSIRSTLRSSTHAAPYYDYDRHLHCESAPFSDPDHITVMAVDTCPNALALDTSTYFGKMLQKHVFEPLLAGENSDVIDRATILRHGRLTHYFEYLKDWVEA